MSQRAGLRLLQRTRFAFRQNTGRRYQTADATAAPPQSIFSRLWNSPVGVKTVHFWAPVMKWSLVLAGISDFTRPAENLSLTQNLALTATGAIWTRWCFVIKPRNLLLAAVNFFLMCVGVTQVSRILIYQKNHKGETAGEALKENADDIAGTAKGAVNDPKEAAHNAGAAR